MYVIGDPAVPNNMPIDQSKKVCTLCRVCNNGVRNQKSLRDVDREVITCGLVRARLVYWLVALRRQAMRRTCGAVAEQRNFFSMHALWSELQELGLTRAAASGAGC